jgi:3-oxoacyl-[acyl-carrier-protein] synthase III
MSGPLRVSPAVPYARIMAVGGYRPERIVTNAEVCERIDSTDEWIQERSGIRERHYASKDETVCDMAIIAAEKAIAAAGISAKDVGAVIIATVTHPYPTPSAAAEVAYRLGTNRAAAFDISAACAGFCFWGADGSHLDTITMTQSMVDYRDHGGAFPTLSMQGQTVFRWAVGEMAKVATRPLSRPGITADELDAFIPHQANLRIVDAMVRQLQLPDHVPVARDITHMGNTSAASIPLAMERMLETGEIPSGGTALLIGFGAGLAYAAQVVTLP